MRSAPRAQRRLLVCTAQVSYLLLVWRGEEETDLTAREADCHDAELVGLGEELGLNHRSGRHVEGWMQNIVGGICSLLRDNGDDGVGGAEWGKAKVFKNAPFLSKEMAQGEEYGNVTREKGREASLYKGSRAVHTPTVLRRAVR